MERKLASVQIISAIHPIKNADFINEVEVMGWRTVVKKSDGFKVGDKCIFCEVDSILPDEPWAAFMRDKKFRIKSAKLRGVLSQGIAFPISILPEAEDMEVGTEVTSLLGITKYELPEPVDQSAKGNFPSFIPKTDEIRLQSCLEVIDEIKKVPFYITVKCDGTSSTFAKFNDDFIVCSRNLELKPGNNDYFNIAEKYNLSCILPEGFSVQGEICGPRWQKNRLMLSEPDLFVFNVFNIKEGKYLDYFDFVDFCSTHGLKTVPLEKVVYPDRDEFDFSLNSWLKLAEGKYSGTNNNREGIVIRPLLETHSRTLRGRLSFKVINNVYLLKDEE